LWCTGRTGDKTAPKKELEEDEKEAVEFLQRLMECNPAKRITADEALRHPFIASDPDDDLSDEVDA
jgi:cell division control protein 7